MIPAPYNTVQIPLWSMNTMWKRWNLWSMIKFRFLYGRWIHRGSGGVRPALYGSDSSMVDEYVAAAFGMVHKIEFRFLYGRWIQKVLKHVQSIENGSDSSMVDEYHSKAPGLSCRARVQIPLWSMNTARGNQRPGRQCRFRFLYGRWIQR